MTHIGKFCALTTYMLWRLRWHVGWPCFPNSYMSSRQDTFRILLALRTKSPKHEELLASPLSYNLRDCYAEFVHMTFFVNNSTVWCLDRIQHGWL